MASQVYKPLKDHSHYFSLWEEDAWNTVYNPQTKTIESDEPLAWGKTNIIIQKCGVQHQYFEVSSTYNCPYFIERSE